MPVSSATLPCDCGGHKDQSACPELDPAYDWCEWIGCRYIKEETTSFWLHHGIFTNLDFSEIIGFPFIGYLLGAEVVCDRYNLTKSFVWEIHL